MLREKQKTLRLVMPEWQGGDYDLSVGSGELYPLGARLLAFLAPRSDCETVEVPIAPYQPGHVRDKENGVVNQQAVLTQMRAARDILEAKQPDRVVCFGGECLVSCAPFDYLNGRYKGNLGVLWIDAHPDVSTPANHDREHAMVLGDLLGGGDPVMAKEVRHRLEPSQVLLVGMDGFDSPREAENIKAYGLRLLPPKDVAANSDAVLAWIRESGAQYLAIHLDLDVLDPATFFSQLTNDPDATEKYPTVKGKLHIAQVTRLLKDVAAHTKVVGLTIAEFFSWDALHLQKMMGQLEIMK